MYPYYIAADTQISDSKVEVTGVVLTGGSDAATLTLYDEADDSKTAGAVRLTIKAAANTTAVVDVPFLLRSGCYADISGTSPVATIIIK